ncbi:MAG: M48 family metalloprotease [Bacteroidota bacterium]
MKKNIYFGLLLLLISILLYSCGSFNINVYPTSEDLRLGKDVAEQIKSHPSEYPILKHNEVKNFIQSIVNEIIKSPELKYRGTFVYTVEVINNDSVINAFCAPGGYIYVYTGLLKFIDNEATLAGILAHEIAHAECRHATSRMTKSLGMKVLSDAIVKETKKSKTASLATNLFSGLSLMNNSRDNEYEADEFSFKYLLSTKWYPGSILFFFDKIKVSADENDLKLLLSTHPMPQDRYDKIISLLKQYNIPPSKESNMLYRHYQEFKKTLR